MNKYEKCNNCKEDFIYFKDHWHCVAYSCKIFTCKRKKEKQMKKLTKMQLAGKKAWETRRKNQKITNKIFDMKDLKKQVVSKQFSYNQLSDMLVSLLNVL